MSRRIAKPLVLLFSLLFLGSAIAGTVAQVGVGHMISRSALVIHATVIDRWTTLDDSQQVLTHVLFDVHDVIKGEYAESTLEVTFLGGTFGAIQLSISDQFIPAVGEEGVYFLENPDLNMINPLYGWRQGHFPVRYDEFGQQKFAYTHNLEPIYSVSPDVSPPGQELSKGAALGIISEPSAAETTSMTLEQFKRRLSALAEELQ